MRSSKGTIPAVTDEFTYLLLTISFLLLTCMR
jgi:hypothetical protein